MPRRRRQKRETTARWAIKVMGVDSGKLFVPYATRAARDAAFKKMKSLVRAGDQHEMIIIFALSREPRGSNWYADDE